MSSTIADGRIAAATDVPGVMLSTNTSVAGPPTIQQLSVKPAGLAVVKPRAADDLACRPCRDRKVQCGKQRPVCDRCAKRAGGARSCFYVKSKRTGRKRDKVNVPQSQAQPHPSCEEQGPSPDASKAELHQFITRMRAEMNELRSGRRRGVGIDTVDAAQVKLGKVVLGRTFLDDPYWLSPQFTALNDSDDSDLSAAEDGLAQSVCSPESINIGDVVLSPLATYDDLDSLHPRTSDILKHWQIYLGNCDTLLKMFHTPTMNDIVHQTVRMDRIGLDSGDELLMFCFYFAAVCSLDEDECMNQLGEGKRILAQKYQRGIMITLSRADFMNTRDFKTIQGLALYLTCLKHTDEKHGAAAWLLNKSAIHLAEGIGMNYDGQSLRLPPFETEMRRRIWWQLLLTDLRLSEGRGCLSMLLEFDTKLPTLINDDDISAATSEYPVARLGPCDMTISCVRMELAHIGRQIQGRNAFEEKISQAVKKQKIDALQASLAGKFRGHESSDLLNYSFTTAKLITSRMHLMNYVRRKDLSPSEATWLFDISLDILEYCGSFKNASVNKRWSWLLKTGVQWHAIAFCLSELCRRHSHNDTDHKLGTSDEHSHMLEATIERAKNIVEVQEADWIKPTDSPAVLGVYESVTRLLRLWHKIQGHGPSPITNTPIEQVISSPAPCGDSSATVGIHAKPQAYLSSQMSYQLQNQYNNLQSVTAPDFAAPNGFVQNVNQFYAEPNGQHQVTNNNPQPFVPRFNTIGLMQNDFPNQAINFNAAYSNNSAFHAPSVQYGVNLNGAMPFNGGTIYAQNHMIYPQPPPYVWDNVQSYVNSSIGYDVQQPLQPIQQQWCEPEAHVDDHSKVPQTQWGEHQPQGQPHMSPGTYSG